MVVAVTVVGCGLWCWCLCLCWRKVLGRMVTMTQIVLTAPVGESFDVTVWHALVGTAGVQARRRAAWSPRRPAHRRQRGWVHQSGRQHARTGRAVSSSSRRSRTRTTTITTKTGRCRSEGPSECVFSDCGVGARWEGMGGGWGGAARYGSVSGSKPVM